MHRKRFATGYNVSSKPLRPRPAPRESGEAPRGEAPRGEQQVLPPPPLPCPGGFLYAVQPGDTLFSLARRFGVSLWALSAANPQVPDPNRFLPGQVICVPSLFAPGSPEGPS